jgi:hypothetical protein
LAILVDDDKLSRLGIGACHDAPGLVRLPILLTCSVRICTFVPVKQVNCVPSPACTNRGARAADPAPCQ